MSVTLNLALRLVAVFFSTNFAALLCNIFTEKGPEKRKHPASECCVEEIQC